MLSLCEIMISKKLWGALRRFKNDINGNFGVMAAITVLGLISGVGLSIDGQRFYAHSAKAQSVADAAGLAAAIHASGENGIPTQAAPGTFVHGQTYSATDLGFDLSTGENITFMVEYNNTDREVIVTTTGTVTPLMLQLVGKTAITSTNRSTVKFDEPGVLTPASVLFVLDNSGSMLFDDQPLDFTSLSFSDIQDINSVLSGSASRSFAEDVIQEFSEDGAIPRISALQSDMTTFNTQLASVIGNQGSANEFLRTGLITYNSGIIRERPLNWGALDQEQDINRMEPIGGTNSSVAFEKAVQDFADEDTQHLNRNGSLEPSKYLVFMSDGQNTDSSNATIWRAVPSISSTGYFRAWGNNVCRFRNFFGGCIQTYGNRYVHWDVDVQGAGGSATTPTEAGFGGTWEEGRYVTPGDDATITDCTALKANGVQIYTIAFALDTGWFDTGTFPDDAFSNYSSANQIRRVQDDDVERAFSLLDACATDDSTFLLANNASDLTIAFNQIRQQIAEDIVRLRE